MASIVNSNRKKRNSLDRGHDIKPATSFSMDSLEDTPKKEAKEETKEATTQVAPEVVAPDTKKIDRVTFYANVRINNHIKNKLEALTNIGLAKSQKDALDRALEYYVDSLPDETKRKFNIQVATLEERDVTLKSK